MLPLLIMEAFRLFSVLERLWQQRRRPAHVERYRRKNPNTMSTTTEIETPDDIHAAAERARILRDELQAHNIAYYVNDSPTVSDAEYDLLMRELQALEAKFPNLSRRTRRTQRVGAAPVSAFGR
jgi:hypothetical protein